MNRHVIAGLILGIGFGVVGYLTVQTTLIHQTPATVDLSPSELQTDIQSNSVSDFSRTEGKLLDQFNRQAKQLLSQVETWDKDQIVQAIQRMTNVKSVNTTESISMIVLGELARLDPPLALKKVWSFPSIHWNEFITCVFEEWSTQDLTEALEAASDLVGPIKEVALSAILKQQAYSLEKNTMDWVQEIGLNDLVQQLLLENATRRLLNNPQDAWNYITEHRNLTYLQRHDKLVIEVAKAWKQKDGFDVYEQIHYDVYHSNRDLFEQVVLEISKEDVQQTFEWIIGRSVVLQKAAANVLLADWAAQDPAAAIQASQRLDKSSIRTSARATILYVWANNNPQNLLNHVQFLPKLERSKATRYVIENLTTFETDYIEEMIQQLTPVVGAIDSFVVDTLVRSWSKFDPVAAFEWVKSNTEKESQQFTDLVHIILSDYAIIDPSSAMTLAQSLSALSSTLETEVIGQVANFVDIDVAIELLDGISEESTIRSFETVGQSLISSNRGDDAIRLASKLPEKLQRRYFVTAVSRWSTDQLHNVIPWIEKLPSDRTKSEVAQSVLLQFGRDGLYGSQLKDSQIEKLESLVLPEQK